MTGGRRFGGAYSPGGPPPGSPPRMPHTQRPWAGRAAASVSMRALGLLVLPSALLLGAFWALTALDVARVAALLGAWALLIGGGLLTREGLTAAAAYQRRAVARPPAFPRKLLGAALTALGVAACAWLGGAGVIGAVGFGALAAGLHVVAFGPDPMASKGLDGLSGAALDAAVTKIETARRLVGEMTDAAAGFHQPGLSGRVRGLADAAMAVIEKLERDPTDLPRARRFLAVYLVGARDATVKFAQSWAESGDPDVAARYAALVDDLQDQFSRHADALAEGDRLDLDVEIEVLRDRLKSEGV